MVKSLSTKVTGLGKGTKKGAPKIGTPSDAVSYTHLTLPTKRIV